MGHHNRHFAGDTYASTGIWGNPTSKANFCEEDYAITRFVAEFINSLTNLAYVYFALRYPCRQRSRGWATRRLDSLSIALVVLGITSAAFHATLRQAPQLSDDLSMLFLAGTLMQKIYCEGQPPSRAWLTSVSIWLPATVVALIYVRSGNILIHTTTFEIMLVLIGARLLYLIYGQERSEAEKAWLMSRFGKGVTSLLVAFTLWNIDLELCHQLREIREHVGLPWAWLLELHGWWHILTAVGAAYIIEIVRELCDREPGQGFERNSTTVNTRRRTQGSFSLMSRRVMTEKSKADLDRIGSVRPLGTEDSARIRSISFTKRLIHAQSDG